MSLPPQASVDAGAYCPGLLFGAVILNDGASYVVGRFDPAGTPQRPIMLGTIGPEWSTLSEAWTFAIECAVEADRCRLETIVPQRAFPKGSASRAAYSTFARMLEDCWASMAYGTSLTTVIGDRKKVSSKILNMLSDVVVTITFLVAKLTDTEIPNSYSYGIRSALERGQQYVGTVA